MQKTTNEFASYWRNSLADADLGKGAWTAREKLVAHSRPLTELLEGEIDRDTLASLWKNEANDCEAIDVVINPFVYVAKPEHGSIRARTLPQTVAPVVIKGKLLSNGILLPSDRIVIARDVLEPIDRFCFTIGSVADLDTFLANNAIPHCLTDLDYQNLPGDFVLSDVWDETLAYSESMLNAVAPHWTKDLGGFLLTDNWLIRKLDSADSPSRRIAELYDHLRQSAPETPLFETYCRQGEALNDPPLPTDHAFSRHLGHASDTYPLAKAQRDALTHLTFSKEGEILGVNGPPGTGKTTLILSVVASLWVESAIAGREPPVIVATSTNNQAVTNIIDAFGKDFANGTGAFAGRWLPNIKSYGCYLAAKARLPESSEQYQTQAFFDQVESLDYFHQAREAYMGAARRAFPELQAPTVKTVVQHLHQRLTELADRLTTIELAHKNFEVARQKAALICNGDPHQALERVTAEFAKRKRIYAALETAYARWQNFMADEPPWYSLLNFIPQVRQRRALRASEAAKNYWRGIPKAHSWNSVDDIRGYFNRVVRHYDKQVSDARNEAEVIRQTHLDLSNSEQDWLARASHLVATGAGAPADLSEANILADTSLRFELFRLATHYWEGRWLLEMEANELALDDLKRKRGKSATEARWRRRMMLTPCAVTTFYMLPGEMQYTRHDGSFVADYLYNFADLLIVDEAGQVLPEVGGASFALAKRALVIGDTLQIEPIWRIPRFVDVGNLIHYGLLSRQYAEEEVEQLKRLGKTAAGGSVMAIAQAQSRYHYDRDLPRGMVLYEHRRCYDEIVSYCNALCYRDKLVPMRGPAPAADHNHDPAALPAMGYLHIPGVCTTNATGSRSNLLEAHAIAHWLHSHREALESRYRKPIGDIVGIVTPFVGQVDALRTKFAQLDLPAAGESGITIGTVHALQGAERAIVIFSPVYTVKDDGGFIDASPSMLNVAVSRARDSFLVFGDIDTFNPKQPGTPRGLLGVFLRRSPSNQLSFAIPADAEAVAREAEPDPELNPAPNDAVASAGVEASAAAHENTPDTPVIVEADHLADETLLTEMLAEDAAGHLFVTDGDVAELIDLEV